MEALTTIIERLAQRIDYIQNHPPRTNRDGDDIVTIFDGKEYKNLNGWQVNDLSLCAYSEAYRLWKEARTYNNYLEYHFTPTADYYLREMREHLIY